MKKRDLYLSQLLNFKDKPVIKVITGIRRCGKSSLLSLYREQLLAEGIVEHAIIQINFESLAFDSIKDYRDLYEYVKGKISTSGKTYILLDEVQQVSEWEKSVNSFLVDFNVDLTITGSNAYLLSSELSTLLSGRYVEIKMLPLSFKEYLDFMEVPPKADKRPHFNRYLEFGGFPSICELDNRESIIRPFLSGIYNTVIMKDVIQRNQVRDAALLENVVKYVVENIGSPVSTKKISDYLTSHGRKTTSDTIDNYLRMLENAFILYKASRFDLKGKMQLKTLEKYYVVDTGIRNDLLGFRGADYGHILENVVYFELLRQGYQVSVGKIGTLEVDFIATKPETKLYVQVCASILDEATLERELRPLQAIPDHYEKIILTMDQPLIRDYGGIHCKNLMDFLLMGDGD
ncbi:MAG: ATP-binding protein [Porticoccaceae bacterium]